MDPLPKQTLYIRNINEKIHVERMKLYLFTIFSRYGKVIDVIIKKRMKLRGQAWVVYETVAEAIKAKEKLNGRLLCKKKLDIQFAKTQSDTIVKLKNPEEYKLRLKKRREENN